MDRILQSNATNTEIARQGLLHIDREASVLEASKLMRLSGATELLVVDKANGALFSFGIVTAKDIVVRVIATELDPAVLTAGDIAWSGPAAPEPAIPGVI